MKLSTPKRWLSRLATRMYVVSLTQILIVVAGTATFLIISSVPPFRFEETMGFVARTVADTAGTPAEIERVLARAHATLGLSLAVYDEADNLVAYDASVTRAPTVREAPSTSTPAIAARMKDGRAWHLALVGPRPPPPVPAAIPFVVLVMVVFSVGSLLAARSIARPLAHLADTARAFGAGHLQARAELRRADELGEVALAFDHMADRISLALRAEKELLANVSHELRTPLQRIHIAIELAAEGDASTAQESLREIAEDLGELDRIVDDVLAATRLSLQDERGSLAPSASPPIRLQAVDVRGLIEKSAARFRAAHPARALRVRISDDLPVIAADAVLLRRVLDNLLDNAHKYTENPAADITVLVVCSGTKILVEVRDRGIGIAPDDLARVFEPFFRADRSRTRSTGGLGLGLALARRIVDAHGGTLTIESLIGRGTTARIGLPIRIE